MLCHCRQGTDYRTILKEERDSMMKINKNEQDFVLKYFQPGKLDTEGLAEGEDSGWHC